MLLKKNQMLLNTLVARNTGVVHTPFYLNPEKKKIFAKSAHVSHDLWKILATDTLSRHGMKLEL